MNDQLSKKLDPQEVGSLVQNPTRTEEAAGNSLHDHPQQFKGLDPGVQFRVLGESAGFMRRVSVGMRHRTIQDVNGGFGDRTGSCREFSLPREPLTGQVLEVEIICHLDVYGVEVLIPSTSGNNTNFGVEISRGPLRYVDKLRYNDPDYSPESFEEADCECIEEIHAEQPTTQARSQCRRSEDHILIDTREWIDIIANEHGQQSTLEISISKMVMRLVRHMDLQTRESDGAVHWKSMGPKLRCAFLRDGGDSFSDTDRINHIWKGSSETRFQYCKNSHNDMLDILAIQGHTGGDVIALELMGHVAVPCKRKSAYLTEDVHLI